MQDSTSPNRTLDLASALEVGPPGSTKAPGENPGQGGCTKSVMTIAFQFAFEMHLQDNVASMARQYLRSIIASVQRVALALSPTNFGSHVGLRPPPGMPEAHTLTRWICQSYRLVTQNPNPSQTWTRICCTRQHMTYPTNWTRRCYLGVELLKNEDTSESLLKSLWHHTDAIMCCSLRVNNYFCKP